MPRHELISVDQAETLSERMRAAKRMGIPVTHMVRASGLSPGTVLRAIEGTGATTAPTYQALQDALDRLEANLRPREVDDTDTAKNQTLIAADALPSIQRRIKAANRPLLPTRRRRGDLVLCSNGLWVNRNCLRRG